MNPKQGTIRNMTPAQARRLAATSEYWAQVYRGYMAQVCCIYCGKCDAGEIVTGPRPYHIACAQAKHA